MESNKNEISKEQRKFTTRRYYFQRENSKKMFHIAEMTFEQDGQDYLNIDKKKGIHGIRNIRT